MNLMTRYFDDAVRIYAICGDEALSDDDARLLSYIHVKACESDKGIDYFDDPSPHDEEALSILLGETMVADTMVTAKGEVVELGNDMVSDAHSEIGALDQRFENDLGMERRLSGELRSRLCLYHDEQFRRKMTATTGRPLNARSAITGKKRPANKKYCGICLKDRMPSKG
jgi:hypothetical protein